MLDGGTDRRPGSSPGSTKSGSATAASASYAHAAAPQKIDALIVGDAKQPRRERAAVVEGVEAAIGAKNGVLDYIFAIRDRAGHPGTVAVQAGPKRADGLQKCQVSSFKLSGVFHISTYPPAFVRAGLGGRLLFPRGISLACRDQAP